MNDKMKSTKLSTSGSVQSYIVGFILSMLLTVASFGLVQYHVNSNHETISHGALSVAVFVFAMSQLAVQLVFFLHLGREQKPRRQSLSFIFVAFIIAFLVVGSLWIMANLDYSHGGMNNVSPTQNDTHIIEDEGLSR
jgi:cytochrome o ubiquinol oxidase operon protein cyoD